MRGHALDHKLFTTLYDDPMLSSELFDAINQLRGLPISDFAKLMIDSFKDILFPLHRHFDKVREHEQELESKKASAKENLGKVVQATEELSNTLTLVDSTNQKLGEQDKRVAEIQK